jgi:hypothetical protein
MNLQSRTNSTDRPNQTLKRVKNVLSAGPFYKPVSLIWKRNGNIGASFLPLNFIGVQPDLGFGGR